MSRFSLEYVIVHVVLSEQVSLTRWYHEAESVRVGVALAGIVFFASYGIYIRKPGALMRAKQRMKEVFSPFENVFPEPKP